MRRPQGSPKWRHLTHLSSLLPPPIPLLLRLLLLPPLPKRIWCHPFCSLLSPVCARHWLVTSCLFLIASVGRAGHSCSLCPVVSSTVPPSASLLKPSIEMFNDADVRRQLEALPVCDASLDSTKQHTCQRAIFAALGKHCEAHCFRVCDVVRALNPESPAPAHQRCRVNLYILLNALKSSLYADLQCIPMCCIQSHHMCVL